MRFASLSLAALASLLTLAPTGVVAGPAAYGLCQTGTSDSIYHDCNTSSPSPSLTSEPFIIGCNGVAVACYAAAGYTFGTVTAGAGIPAVIAGCNSALGTYVDLFLRLLLRWMSAKMLGFVGALRRVRRCCWCRSLKFR
jgi:hypothetical protein